MAPQIRSHKKTKSMVCSGMLCCGLIACLVLSWSDLQVSVHVALCLVSVIETKFMKFIFSRFSFTGNKTKNKNNIFSEIDKETKNKNNIFWGSSSLTC